MGLRNSIRRTLDRDFRPVFLAGIAGSGTTLLSGLLDQHFITCACFHESARQAPPDSPLYTENFESYPSLAAYAAVLFGARHVSPERLRRWTMRLYRSKARYPKPSNVVIDKAPNCHLARMKGLKEAFANAKVLVIFRDPVASIEGLRRKWPGLFGAASIEAVCDFWERLHLQMIEDARSFEEDVSWIAYEDLVRDPEGWVERIGAECGLERRPKLRKYDDKPNAPGKGLRNISGGVIQVVDTIDAPLTLGLSETETLRIRARLGGLYETLHARSRPVATAASAGFREPDPRI